MHKKQLFLYFKNNKKIVKLFQNENYHHNNKTVVIIEKLRNHNAPNKLPVDFVEFCKILSVSFCLPNLFVFILGYETILLFSFLGTISDSPLKAISKYFSYLRTSTSIRTYKIEYYNTYFYGIYLIANSIPQFAIC